jgi:hypothetical protein
LEIGHHINQRLGGLSRLELFPQILGVVTKTTRRVARYDERFFENRNEYYAETWSRFLCGDKKRTLLRYLDKPIRHIRMKHPERLG